MAATKSISVHLPARLVEAIEQAVATGECPSADEAVADAVEVWSRRHEDRAEELAWVKAKIGASLLDPRPSLSMAEVEAHMDEVFRRAKERDDAAA